MDIHLHVDLLRRSDRAAGLRTAIFGAVRRGARVLDAGCGTGVLSIIAAQAGAGHVTAVDQIPLDLARELARQNGVERSIEFIQADLRHLDLTAQGGFDVLLALVYFNDPRRDEAQSSLVAELRKRWLKPDGIVIPERVRYRACPCEWPSQDWPARVARLDAALEEIENLYRLRVRPLRDAALQAVDLRWFPRRTESGTLVRHDCRLLGSPTAAFEIDYRTAEPRYPETLQLRVSDTGVANSVLWVQELIAGDSVVFANESVSWLREPAPVQPGQTCTVALDDVWRRSNVLPLLGVSH